eukprot:3818969-Prymnesium_polylepis.1
MHQRQGGPEACEDERDPEAASRKVALPDQEAEDGQAEEAAAGQLRSQAHSQSGLAQGAATGRVRGGALQGRRGAAGRRR